MATPLGNVDRISALLIAQLSLDEIGQLEQPNEPGHPISDEDYALRLMAEEFARVLAATDEDDDENIFAWPVMYNEVLPESTDSNGSSTEDSESDSIEDHLQYTSQSSDEECAESELVSLKTCAVCREDLVEDIVFTLRSCGHHYCGMCLEQCIETCIETESMFPPKCCDQNMAFAHSLGSSTENLAQFLDDKRLGRKSNLGNRLRNKAIEFGLPPEHRVYCPNPRCSTFLCSSDSLRASGSSSRPPPYQCPSCPQLVCVLCKGSAHPDTIQCPISAEEELLEAKLRELAQSKRWQSCPGCKAIVEQTQGCNHMACRCGTEFCYLCGGKWIQVCVCQG